MRRHGLFAALMIVGGLVAGQASAGVLYLTVSSVTPTNPTPGVPEITLDPTGVSFPATMTLIMWYQLPTDEKVNGLTVDLVMDSTGHAISTSTLVPPVPVITNAGNRWEAGIVKGTVGGASKLIDNMRLFAVTTAGLNGEKGILSPGETTTSYKAASQSFRVASVTISAVGMAPGTTNVWITTNLGGGISYAEGQFQIGEDPDTGEPIMGTWNNPATTGFGTAGDQVDPRSAGVTGAVADAIIHVVPEPASLSLLALGGLALARRRRA